MPMGISRTTDTSPDRRPGSPAAEWLRPAALARSVPSKPQAPGSSSNQMRERIRSRLAADARSRKNSPHHRGNVRLHRPDQRDHPSDHRPAQKKVQQHNRSRIPLIARKSKNRWQKIHHEPKADKRQEKRWQEVSHNDLLITIA